MVIILDTQAGANGWLAVLAIACLFAAVYIATLLRRDLARHGLSWRSALVRSAHRLLAGGGIMLACLGLRFAGFWPARPLMIGTDWATAHAWLDAWAWVADALAIGAVLGLTIMMWPALHRAFGKWALPVVGGLTMVVWLAGAIGTLWLAGML